MDNQVKRKSPKQVAQPVKQNVKLKKKRVRRPKSTIYQENSNVAQTAIAPRYGGMLKLQKKTSGLSPAGVSFLKCAFAPPDFAGGNVAGAPDSYMGKSLVKKHKYAAPFNISDTTQDYYLLLAPVPGMAYFMGSVPQGTPVLNTTIFYGQPYSDFSNLFGQPSDLADKVNQVVTKYRMVSNHFEFMSTVNDMSWNGSISSWRIPVSLVMDRETGSTSPNLWSVGGLKALNATNADTFLASWQAGIYAAAYNTGSNFDFQPIMAGVQNVPTIIETTGGDFGQLFTGYSGGTYAFPGLDNNFDTVVIKIAGLSGELPSSSGFIRTWSCVEYQALPGSNVYEYQTISQCDPVALDLYRRIILELPVAVAFRDNADFWQRVLRIIKQISGAGAFVPGPYGMVSGGVNSIASGLERIFF